MFTLVFLYPVPDINLNYCDDKPNCHSRVGIGKGSQQFEMSTNNSSGFYE